MKRLSVDMGDFTSFYEEINKKKKPLLVHRDYPRPGYTTVFAKFMELLGRLLRRFK